MPPRTLTRCCHCEQLIAYYSGEWLRIEQERPDWIPFSYPDDMCPALAFADDERHEP